MPTFRRIFQHAFNAGVLDPRMRGRTDIDAYYQGMSVAENVYISPQGALERRPGIRALRALPPDSQPRRLFNFTFNQEQEYLITARVHNNSLLLEVMDEEDGLPLWIGSDSGDDGRNLTYSNSGSVDLSQFGITRPAAAAYHGGHFYVADQEDGFLHRINVADQTNVTIGNTGLGDLRAMTSDGTNLYGADGEDNRIYRISTANASTTLQCAHTLDNLAGLVYRSGVFLACSSESKNLHRITLSGSVSVIGQIAANLTGVLGLDLLGSTLYALGLRPLSSNVNRGQPVFFIVNPSSGTGTFLSALPLGKNLNYYRLESRHMGLASDDHVLYAVFSHTDRMYPINETTGNLINSSLFVFEETEIPWTESELAEIDVAQLGDTMIIVHENHQPRSLLRNGSDTDWLFSRLQLRNIPTQTFSDSFYPQEFVLSLPDVQDLSGLAPSSAARQRVFLEGSIDAGDYYRIRHNGITTKSISANPTGDTVAVQEAFDEAFGRMFVSITGTNRDYTVNFVEGGYQPLLEVINDFTHEDEIVRAVHLSPGSDGFEHVWSNVSSFKPQPDGSFQQRGWPRTCAFHQGRLWFGGSKSLPQTIWASRVNDYFNFFIGDTDLRDDYGIQATIDSKEINPINRMLPEQDLLVFTSRSEYAIGSLRGQPVTPETVTARLQTTYGCRKNVQPVSLEGTSVFAQTYGNAIRQLHFSFGEDQYIAGSLSVRAAHLIKGVKRLATLIGAGDDVNQLFVLNDDGTIAAFTSERNEDVGAWSVWKMDNGRIDDIVAIGDRLYMIGSVEIYDIDFPFIGFFDRDFQLDFAIDVSQGYPAEGHSGLGNFDLKFTPNLPVSAYYGTALHYVCTDDGVDIQVGIHRIPPMALLEISMIEEGVDCLIQYIGVPFTVLVKTMPINLVKNEEDKLSEIVQLSKITPLSIASTVFEVEGQEVAVPKNNRFPDDSDLVNWGWSLFSESSAGDFNDFVDATGFERGRVVKIEQTVPGPFTLAGLIIEGETKN